MAERLLSSYEQWRCWLNIEAWMNEAASPGLRWCRSTLSDQIALLLALPATPYCENFLPG
jgi:hypothetical protein